MRSPAKNATRPKVYVVGVGPGSPEYVTERARAAIGSAQIVLGWKLDLLPIKKLLRGKEVHLQNVSNYRRVAARLARTALKAGKSVAVARVGDPCISSGLAGLLQSFSGYDAEIIPGISSTQLAASIARINLDDSVIVSFHDYGDHEREKSFMLGAFRAGRHLIVLTSPDLTPGETAKLLISNGVEPSTPVLVCSNLSLDDERIDRGTLKGVSERNYDWLSLLVILNTAVPSNQEAYSAWKRWRAEHQKLSRVSKARRNSEDR